jgi:hypothetical protein
MKRYQSPEIHFETIAPEETLLLSYSNEGDAGEFDLGEYLSKLNGGNGSRSATSGFDDGFN